MLRWTNDRVWAQLDVDVSRMCASISSGDGDPTGPQVWHSDVEA
jgi:hypothetical protein